MATRIPTIFSPPMDGDDTELDAVAVFLTDFGNGRETIEPEHIELWGMDQGLPDGVGAAWRWTLRAGAPAVRFEEVPPDHTHGIVAWLQDAEVYAVAVCSTTDVGVLEEMEAMHRVDPL